MNRKQVISIVLLVIAGVFMAGCTEVEQGPPVSAVTYLNGNLQTAEAKRLDIVYETVLKTMEELEMKVIRKKKSNISAEVVGKDAKNNEFRIKMYPITDETTKLSIHVGFFGDEKKSRFMYQKIHDNLK